MTNSKKGQGSMRVRLHRMSAGAALVLAATALSGCISMGKKPPASLYDLTPAKAAPAGAAANGTLDQALAVMVPDAPQRLDVPRVPVQVDASTVAYLKDAQWVEKPARLFAHLLVETIRAKQTRMVIEGADIRYSAATKLSGQLVDMGYDARSSSAVVRYDAVLQQANGAIQTRRFEAEVSGVAPDAKSVGPALNEAANKVAADVADWVG